MRAFRFLFAFSSAAIVALALVALPRVLPGITTGGILLPCLVLWWVVFRGTFLPRWWALAVIILIDITTFTPAGALTMTLLAVAAVLRLIDRISPQETFLHIALRAVLAITLTTAAATGILFLRLSLGSLPFPWQSVAFDSVKNSIGLIIVTALLWNIRQQRLRAWL